MFAAQELLTTGIRTIIFVLYFSIWPPYYIEIAVIILDAHEDPENQMKADPSGSVSATLQTQKVKWKRIQVYQDQQPCKPRKSNENGYKWIRISNPPNPENQMNAIQYEYEHWHLCQSSATSLVSVSPLHCHWQQHPFSQLSLHKFRHKQLRFR